MPPIFPHRHILDIASLSREDIGMILDLAGRYAERNRSPDRKSDDLKGQTVVNLFFEPSTRTRTSFEIAAHRLGADVVNFGIENSSTKKGETLRDTLQTINAMRVDAVIIRHEENGTAAFAAEVMESSILNAGDGTHAHPTQALLDALTLRRHKGRLQDLTVAICGDIAHSRVARSNIELLKKMGAAPRIVAPESLMPKDLATFGIPAFTDLKEGIANADAVMMLRIQHERINDGSFAMSRETYHAQYGLDHDKLKAAKPDAIVLHPGPINRDVEISSALADDATRSKILEQVEHGVAIRMACLKLVRSP